MNTPELYERWMETETSYSSIKFSPSYQYSYWEQGVARGHFSFMVSAMNYLQRAKLFSEQVDDEHDPLGLQVVQSLGKAAHNLVVLDATAKSYTSDKKSLLSNQLATFSYLATDLEMGEPSEYIGVEMIKRAQQWRSLQFQSLQLQQDVGDIEKFHALLGPELRFAARQFVAAADVYGWTTPGMSSGSIARWSVAEA